MVESEIANTSMIGRGDSESVAMTHEDFGPEAIGQTGEDSIVGVLYAGKTKKGFGEWADERSSMRVDCLCEQEWCVVCGVGSFRTFMRVFTTGTSMSCGVLYSDVWLQIAGCNRIRVM